MRRARHYFTTCAVVAASGYNEATEFGHLSSHYQLVMLVSVGDGV
jgi:hypothetical protein